MMTKANRLVIGLAAAAMLAAAIIISLASVGNNEPSFSVSSVVASRPIPQKIFQAATQKVQNLIVKRKESFPFKGKFIYAAQVPSEIQAKVNFKKAVKVIEGDSAIELILPEPYLEFQVYPEQGTYILRRETLDLSERSNASERLDSADVFAVGSMQELIDRGTSVVISTKNEDVRGGTDFLTTHQAVKASLENMKIIAERDGVILEAMSSTEEFVSWLYHPLTTKVTWQKTQN